MRILVYALPRTGSTVLAHYIANSFHSRAIIEPYHEQRFWDKDLVESDIWNKDNVVVKMMFGQGGYWYKDIKDKFNKVVVLYRENAKEQAESYIHAKKSIDWHIPYIYDPSSTTEEEYNEAYTAFKDRIEEVDTINDFKISYEDLYISGKDKDRLNQHLGITNKSFEFMLDSRNKYRQSGSKVKKTLI